MSLTLTRAELIEISGFKQRSKIITWLKNQTYTFDVGADGWPRLARLQYEARHASALPRTLTRSVRDVPNVEDLKEMQRGTKTKKQARPT